MSSDKATVRRCFVDIVGLCLEENVADVESVTGLVLLLKTLLNDRSAAFRVRVVAAAFNAVKVLPFNNESPWQPLLSTISSAIADKSKLVRLKAITVAHEILHHPECSKFAQWQSIVSLQNDLISLVSMPPSAGFNCPDTVNAASLALSSNTTKGRVKGLDLAALFFIPLSGNHRQASSKILSHFLQSFSSWSIFVDGQSRATVLKASNYLAAEPASSALAKNLSPCARDALHSLQRDPGTAGVNACKVLCTLLPSGKIQGLGGIDVDAVLRAQLSKSLSLYAAKDGGGDSKEHTIDCVKWSFRVCHFGFYFHGLRAIRLP